MKVLLQFLALSVALHAAIFALRGPYNPRSSVPHFVTAESELVMFKTGSIPATNRAKTRSRPPADVNDNADTEASSANNLPVSSSSAAFDYIISHGNAAPRYPRSAIAQNQQGQLKLKIQFALTGEAERVDLLESSGIPSLDASALEAARTWRLPGEHPQKVVMVVPVNYQLQ